MPDLPDLATLELHKSADVGNSPKTGVLVVPKMII